MITRGFVTDKVIRLLPIDSDLYVEQLDVLIASAMSKLKEEGVDYAKIEEYDDRALSYCVCIAYQLALDMDVGIDYNRLMQQYITRVNTLRTSLIRIDV